MHLGQPTSPNPSRSALRDAPRQLPRVKLLPGLPVQPIAGTGGPAVNDTQARAEGREKARNGCGQPKRVGFFFRVMLAENEPQHPSKTKSHYLGRVCVQATFSAAS